MKTRKAISVIVVLCMLFSQIPVFATADSESSDTLRNLPRLLDDVSLPTGTSIENAVAKLERYMDEKDVSFYETKKAKISAESEGKSNNDEKKATESTETRNAISDPYIQAVQLQMNGYVPKSGVDVNPATGSVSYVNEDLRLAGRNGMDFVLRRVYNQANSLLRICKYNMATVESRFDQLCTDFDLGDAFSFDFPKIIYTPSYTSNSHKAYIKLPDGNVCSVYANGTFAEYQLTGLRCDEWHISGWRQNPNNGSELPHLTGKYILESLDGKQYKFDNFRLVAIIDRFGNTISFSYASTSSPLVSYVTDSCGRVITFNYTKLNGKVTALTVSVKENASATVSEEVAAYSFSNLSYTSETSDKWSALTSFTDRQKYTTQYVWDSTTTGDTQYYSASSSVTTYCVNAFCDEPNYRAIYYATLRYVTAPTGYTTNLSYTPITHAFGSKGRYKKHQCTQKNVGGSGLSGTGYQEFFLCTDTYDMCNSSQWTYQAAGDTFSAIVQKKWYETNENGQSVQKTVATEYFYKYFNTYVTEVDSMATTVSFFKEGSAATDTSGAYGEIVTYDYTMAMPDFEKSTDNIFGAVAWFQPTTITTTTVYGEISDGEFDEDDAVVNITQMHYDNRNNVTWSRQNNDTERTKSYTYYNDSYNLLSSEIGTYNGDTTSIINYMSEEDDRKITGTAKWVNSAVVSYVSYGVDTYGNYTSMDTKTTSTLSDSSYITYENGVYPVKVGARGVEDYAGNDAQGSSTIAGDVYSQYTFNTMGDLVAVYDGNHNVTTYTYNSTNHRLALVDEPWADENITYSYTLNSTSNYMDINTLSGLGIRITYDYLGNELLRTETEGGVTRKIYEYTYDALGRKKSSKQYRTNTNYTKVVYWYNENGTLRKEKQFNNEASTTFENVYLYEADNNQRKVSQIGNCYDRSTKTVSYYDVYGNLTKKETLNPEAVGWVIYTETWTYNNANQVLTYRDAKANGRKLYPSGNSAYGESAAPSGIYTTAYEYDNAGNVSAVRSGGDNGMLLEENTYDMKGRLIAKASVNASYPELYTYDKLDRLIEKKTPLSVQGASVSYVTTNYKYDGAGNVVYEKTGDLEKGYAYTSHGKIAKVEEYAGSAGYPTYYSYTWDGTLSSVITGGTISYTDSTHTTESSHTNGTTLASYVYNKRGLLASSTESGYPQTTYTYDNAGNLTSKQSGELLTSTYTYDYNNNITQESHAEQYDENPIIINYTYNRLGLLTSTSRNGVTNTYDIDDFGRTISETENRGTYNITKQYVYDGMSNVRSFTLKKNSQTLMTTNYTYGYSNELLTVSDANRLVMSYTYNTDGTLASEEGIGYETEYTYNLAGMTETMVNNRVNNNTVTPLSTFDYEYDNKGFISQITEGGTHRHAYRYENTYDKRGRLEMAETYDADEDCIAYEDYAFNIYGTVTNIDTDDGASAAHSSHSYNLNSAQQPQYTTNNKRGVGRSDIYYTYNVFGSKISEVETPWGSTSSKTTSYTYSQRNQELLGVSRANELSASYTYGADGLRTSKTVNGKKTDQVWSNGQIVAEIESDRTTLYTMGKRRIERRIYGDAYEYTIEEWDEEGETLLSSTDIDCYRESYLYNAQGDVVALINPDIMRDFANHYGASTNSANYIAEFDVDESGAINSSDMTAFLTSFPLTQTYYYDSYGNKILGTYNQSNTNPFGYRGEYYDAELGCIYLRARYFECMQGRFTALDPARDGVNWYAYCGGNPVMFVDPWGLAVTPEDEEALETGKITQRDIDIINEASVLYDTAQKENNYTKMAEAHQTAVRIRLKYDKDYVKNDTFDYTFGTGYSAIDGGNAGCYMLSTTGYGYDTSATVTIFYERTADNYIALKNVCGGINNTPTSGFHLAEISGVYGDLRNRYTFRTQSTSFSYSVENARTPDAGEFSIMSCSATFIFNRGADTENSYSLLVVNGYSSQYYINGSGKQDAFEPRIDPVDLITGRSILNKNGGH